MNVGEKKQIFAKKKLRDHSFWGKKNVFRDISLFATNVRKLFKMGLNQSKALVFHT